LEMDIDEIPRCSSCGTCCRGEHHWGLILLPGDYERWVQEKREDILCYVEQSAYGHHRAIIWKDIQTGKYIDHCPFLLGVDADRYECVIQDTKPKICSMFWCAWAYSEGDRGVPFKTLNGWTERARELGYAHW